MVPVRGAQMLIVEHVFSAWTSQNLVDLVERNNVVKKENVSTLQLAKDQRYGHGNILTYTLQLHIAD